VSARQRSAGERDGYVRLREAIVSGELMPDQRLVEAELGEAFGLGRAAVRTALVRLEQDRLVSREPHRGAKVRRVSAAEAVEVLEARTALESLAVRHAAERAGEAEAADLRAILAEMRRLLEDGDLPGVSDANGRLHRRLLEISGHATARRLCATLASQTVRFQFRTILAPGRPERSLEEHAAIVDAVAAGDPDAAERAMRTHLSHVADALRRRREAEVREIVEQG
jgi:DNA-binding GntR family transcriptional regulator